VLAVGSSANPTRPRTSRKNF